MNRAVLLLTLCVFALSTCLASAQEVTAKKWTVMIFLNGDNNLDSAGSDDVNEMEMIGSTDQVNIIVMQDTEGSSGTKTYLIKKDTKPSQITSPVIRDEPEQDMGDYNTLINFAKYGIQNYPAERYFLAVWNHGAGWQKNGATPLMKGISYDDQSGNHINTPQMGLALKAITETLGRKVDVFGCDACLMQMAEVGYEIKDYALIHAAAEETEPGDGWPYDGFLAPLVANPAMTPREFATNLVDKYVASYSGGTQGSQNVNQSAVDLEKFGEFGVKLNAFSQALVENAHLTGTFKDTIAATQAFYYAQYKDLGDFITKLLPKLDGDLKAKGQDLLDFYKSQVIIRSGFRGASLSGSTGLSIYMPTKSQLDQALASYKELAFSADTAWDEFLQGLYYPNVPVLVLAGADVIENVDGAVNPGDTVKVVVQIKNDGMKPGLGLTVSLAAQGNNATVVGAPVTVDEVPGGAQVSAPAIEVAIAPTCPIDTKVLLTVKIVDAQGKEITGQVEVLVKEKFEHKTNVLLVVANKADAFAPLYKKALADANVACDTWDIAGFGKPSLQLLKLYTNGVVIFNAPDTNDIGKVDLDVLAGYLQAGGNLFLTGQDVGYSIKDKPFYAQYLKSQFVQDNTGITAIQGKGPFAGVDFAIAGGDGANNQKWPDEINPLEGATAVLTYKKTEIAELPSDGQRTDHFRGINGSGTAGVLVAGTFKVLYFSFGFEAISTAALRAKVMGKAMEMLKPTVASRLAGLKALSEQNEVLYSSGEAAFNTAKTAEESYLKLTQDLVKTAKDEQTVKRSGIRELLRQLHAR